MTQAWSGVWERASCRWHTLLHVSFLQHWSAPCRRTRCWPSPTPRTASSCGSVWGRPSTPTSRSCRPWFPGPKAQARATRTSCAGSARDPPSRGGAAGFARVAHCPPHGTPRRWLWVTRRAIPSWGNGIALKLPLVLFGTPRRTPKSGRNIPQCSGGGRGGPTRNIFFRDF